MCFRFCRPMSLHIRQIASFLQSLALWSGSPHFQQTFLLSGPLHLSARCFTPQHLKHLVTLILSLILQLTQLMRRYSFLISSSAIPSGKRMIAVFVPLYPLIKRQCSSTVALSVTTPLITSMTSAFSSASSISFIWMVLQLISSRPYLLKHAQWLY